MTDATLRTVVLENPNHRLVRFVPAFAEEKQRLTDLGLFKPGGVQTQYTVAGYVAHILANEINPRRRYRRTREWLDWAVQVKFHFTVEKTATEVRKALRKLTVAGIAEIDDIPGKLEAWRLRVE